MSGRTIVIPPNPTRIDPALLDAYETRGPRYTSYPTAPHFTPDVDREELVARWRATNDGDAPAGLSFYMHIPFCRARCAFCGCFTTIARDPQAAVPYVDALIGEMDVVAALLDGARAIGQVALGGGTPTFLAPDQLARIFRELKSRWPLAENAELSIEIDPRTASAEHLDTLIASGVNRFSLGVQDFDEHVLETVRREQSLNDTMRVLNHIRRAGIGAVNFDLIYGLPGQTVETMRATAERTAELSPSRIALYGYAHVPWMRPQQKQLERHGVPDAAMRMRLAGVAWDVLVDAGYVPVGMDHFAKPEDELVTALQEGSLHRNFMGYTTRRGLDLVGLGASAISSVGRSYAQNVKELAPYQAAASALESALERGFLLSEDDAMRRELIIDLFCNFRLNMRDFSHRWGIDFKTHFARELKALDIMVEDALVTISDEMLEVTTLGRAFVRNVCMVFDAYLENDPNERRYSKTI